MHDLSERHLLYKALLYKIFVNDTDGLHDIALVSPDVNLGLFWRLVRCRNSSKI